MTTRKCDICGGSGEVNAVALDINNRRALLEELRHLVLNHGATGLESPSMRQRLRAHARVAWLSSRITWLETEDLIASTGEIPAVDPDATVPIRNLRDIVNGHRH